MGQSMSKYMGPLELAGGVGASLLGAPSLGIPLAMSGLGSTVGGAAGGNRGAMYGGLAGGALGGLGEGFAGLGPLGSSLGGTGIGQSLQGALKGTPLGSLMGLAAPSVAPGELGSSTAAGVTPIPPGAPGAFPAPGAPPTEAGLAYQRAGGNLAAAGPAGGGMVGPPDPLSQPIGQIGSAAPPSQTPAAAAAGGAAPKQGMSAKDQLALLQSIAPQFSQQQLGPMGGVGQGQGQPQMQRRQQQAALPSQAAAPATGGGAPPSAMPSSVAPPSTMGSWPFTEAQQAGSALTALGNPLTNLQRSVGQGIMGVPSQIGQAIGGGINRAIPGAQNIAAQVPGVMPNMAGVPASLQALLARLMGGGMQPTSLAGGY